MKTQWQKILPAHHLIVVLTPNLGHGIHGRAELLSLEEILSEGIANPIHMPHASASNLRVGDLMQALLLSVEHEFLDISVDLRSLGVRWTPCTWLRCVTQAHSARRDKALSFLLADFLSSKFSTPYPVFEFCETAAPVLFGVLQGYASGNLRDL
eukprot:m.369832 g.369832  ORF g.369832 m.369832 type:complete len:154 (+) comp19990_c0_seq16:1792-2253(+)